MGVEPFLISSGLVGSVAQRLVRRLCQHCRTLGPPDKSEQALLDLLAGHPVQVEQIGKKVGCAKCNQMGTMGRISIHEVLVMNEEVQHLITARAATSIINEKARETAGFVPMVYDGIEKVVNGVAHLEDVVKKVVSH
jgi:type II secretory ATPase GspE/PulE/Tfp pilus assembly ATPase PilB-like protein